MVAVGVAVAVAVDGGGRRGQVSPRDGKFCLVVLRVHPVVVHIHTRRAEVHHLHIHNIHNLAAHHIQVEECRTHQAEAHNRKVVDRSHEVVVDHMDQAEVRHKVLWSLRRCAAMYLP